jgi:molybdate transport system permease protein
MLRIFSQLPPELWQSLGLTLRLAAVVTLMLLAVGVPMAWWLSASRSRAVPFVEAVVALPIVLPPTVLGFYLLALFAPDTLAGRIWFRATGETLAFSFSGLVVGSVLYSLPYAVQPLASAFRSVPKWYLDASTNLGAGGWTTFRRIVFPLSWRGLGVAAMLSFAHTVGEFGVVVMLGGSIPGKTRVASIALYDEVQKLNYPAAHAFAFVLLAMSLIVLLGMTLLQRGKSRREIR